MRTSAIAFVVVVAAVAAAPACFRTAPYDTAHARRVVSIQARYEAETRREGEGYAARVAALDQLRASAITTAPGSPYAPTDLESLLTVSRNQPVLHVIDEQLAALAERQDEARRVLAQRRDLELRASVAQRDDEIASGRVAHRARVKAAASAFAAKDQAVPSTPSPPGSRSDARAWASCDRGCPRSHRRSR
jgi:hypothetical protein